MADLLYRLPLLLLFVVLLLIVVFFHMCSVGLVPVVARKRRSSKNGDRMDHRVTCGRPAGTTPGASNQQRSAGSVAKQAYDPTLYAHLPSHEIPLPSSDDKGEDARSSTLPLGSGSTQDSAASQSHGGRQADTPWSYTSLLNERMCDDDDNAAVDLSFHLSSSSVAAAMHTRIINPHPNEDCTKQTYVGPCGPRYDGLPPSLHDGGGNRNVSSTQGRGGVGTDQRPEWMCLSPASRSGSGTPRGRQRQEDLPEGGAHVECDDRQLWAECRQALRQAGIETITREVQRLHVGDDDDAAFQEPLDCDDVDCDEDCNSDDFPNIYLYIAGMGHNFGRTKTREWKWEDMRARLQKMSVTRKAIDCGKKWDNLMQQFKKVHKFQHLSGGKDYFKLASSAKRSEGFNFVMDGTVYDEMEAMTKGDHTIHPKNLADTGAAGGAQMPAGAGAGGESMASEGGGEAADEDQGSTKDSKFSAGSADGSGKRKNMWQQTFEAIAEVMDKHGALMASTIHSASKRRCSMMLRQCEILETEVEVQRKHYATADEANRMMTLCNALMEIVKVIRERS
ncbi:hypothetical protein CBR_g37621 [Chara braunii]|uniref:Myb/SANT-like DNA-binding domain-containing protein n=1 Tax=Chara braunii TaxID=69332 RepID=A0A388LNI1_CHABU|nr:hypothetical protein CBR_g37621 [Chara braunii]|eukprot:GBG83821.1 hypothetical protein CBR_g37621 [Chara braunii]